MRRWALPPNLFHVLLHDCSVPELDTLPTAMIIHEVLAKATGPQECFNIACRFPLFNGTSTILWVAFTFR